MSEVALTEPADTVIVRDMLTIDRAIDQRIARVLEEITP